MFPQPLRHTALPLLLVAAFATSAPANWFSDWFHAVSHEELPTPQPESDELLSDAERVPTLIPPHQSHRWMEEGVPEPETPGQEWPEQGWVEEGETLYSNPDPSELPPLGEWNDSDATANVWSDVWGEDDSDRGFMVFDPSFPADADGPPTCCGSPTIRYWNHPLLGLAARHADGTETQYTVLELADACCPIRVPVTIPASCVGVPELETQQGWFGRTTHTFCWPCGYRLKIVRWGEGDLMVHTYNPPDVLPLQCMRSPSGGRLIEL